MTDDPATTENDRLYRGEAVSPGTTRIVSWSLIALLVGFVVYMVLAATVLRGGDAPGVSFSELKDQPIYIHQPPQSIDTRMEQGAAGVPGGSAHRWVVRSYTTRLSPAQTRDWYLRQFGTQYNMADTAVADTRDDRVLKGLLPLSERTTADPPNIAVRIAIRREQVEERTLVTFSLESDY